jgi:hypothetical protein
LPEENKRRSTKGTARYGISIMSPCGARREVLEQLEREDRLGVVLLGRPYHNDPGVNHEILEEFQKLGYPVFAEDYLPIDDDIIWNAPIYTVVEEIVEHSGTPYFCFKDIDENKPTGSIRIRVETIGYFLKRYREDMVKNKKKSTTIEQQLREFEARLRKQMLREKTRGQRPRAGIFRDWIDATDSRESHTVAGKQTGRAGVRDGFGRLIRGPMNRYARPPRAQPPT